jgi:hypothetical protein
MKKINFIYALVFLGLTIASCNHIFEEQTKLETENFSNDELLSQEKALPNGQGKKCNYRLRGSNGGYPTFSCEIMGTVCKCQGGSMIANSEVDLETIKLFFPEVSTIEDLDKIDINNNLDFVQYLNYLRGEE